VEVDSPKKSSSTSTLEVKRKWLEWRIAKHDKEIKSILLLKGKGVSGQK
jgi:hypothetical protein